MKLFAFLRYKTNANELCVIREGGWIIDACWIDYEDLFLVHPKIADKEVKKDEWDYLPVVNENNAKKNIQDYIPKDVIIKIQKPQRDIKKRKDFSFLDEDN